MKISGNFGSNNYRKPSVFRDGIYKKQGIYKVFVSSKEREIYIGGYLNEDEAVKALSRARVRYGELNVTGGELRSFFDSFTDQDSRGSTFVRIL